MARVEVEDTTLQAHAVNDGVTDTMLEGSLRLDRTKEGVAALLELRTVGKKTATTRVLLGAVMRSLRSQSLVVTHDGREVSPDVRDTDALRSASAVRRLPVLKRLPRGRPRLVGEVTSDPAGRTAGDGGVP